MKAILIAICTLLFHVSFGQIKTQNLEDDSDLTIFVLPRNVKAESKLIKHGPPQKGERGRTFFLHYEKGKDYLIKTIETGPKEARIETIESVVKIKLEGNEEIVNDLKLKSTSTREEGRGPGNLVRIFGTLASGETWDITFISNEKSDLRNSYFLDFIDENGYKIEIDMTLK